MGKDGVVELLRMYQILDIFEICLLNDVTGVVRCAVVSVLILPSYPYQAFAHSEASTCVELEGPFFQSNKLLCCAQ